MENFITLGIIMIALGYVSYRMYLAYKGKGCSCSSKCGSCKATNKSDKCI